MLLIILSQESTQLLLRYLAEVEQIKIILLSYLIFKTMTSIFI